MADSFRLILNGADAPAEFYSQLVSVEVEENVDMPGAAQIRLPVSRNSAGDLWYVNEAYFAPFANIAVVATAQENPEECIFDGYVLSQKLHLERGTAASSIEVWAQDASWLMNLEEKTREWANVTDSGAANAIFSEYGFTPAPDNAADDAGPYSEDLHTLMQRGTDAQFLRLLARRTGRLMRVVCQSEPGQRIGVFARPDLEAAAVSKIKLNDPEELGPPALDFEWDATRPSQVRARQSLFTDTSPASGDVTDTGLPALDERTLATFSTMPVTVMLTTPADDVNQLKQRATAALRDGGWFMRCEGEIDLARLKTVLRAGSVVEVEGAGSTHSGKYYVWSVRHSIRQDGHRMQFVLVRNAAGPVPTPPEDLLGGLV